MYIRPIKTEEDYNTAISRIKSLYKELKIPAEILLA